MVLANFKNGWLLKPVTYNYHPKLLSVRSFVKEDLCAHKSVLDPVRFFFHCLQTLSLPCPKPTPGTLAIGTAAVWPHF